MSFQGHGRRGFTLIELLVVISIIGLMASVVLASLSSARQRARDTALLVDFKNLHSLIAAVGNEGQDFCIPGGEVERALNAIARTTSFTPPESDCFFNGAEDWMVYVRLSSTDAYCMDYGGEIAQKVSLNALSGTSCGS